MLNNTEVLRSIHSMYNSPSTRDFVLHLIASFCFSNIYFNNTTKYTYYCTITKRPVILLNERPDTSELSKTEVSKYDNSLAIFSPNSDKCLSMESLQSLHIFVKSKLLSKDPNIIRLIYNQLCQIPS